MVKVRRIMVPSEDGPSLTVFDVDPVLEEDEVQLFGPTCRTTTSRLDEHRLSVLVEETRRGS